MGSDVNSFVNSLTYGKPVSEAEYKKLLPYSDSLIDPVKKAKAINNANDTDDWMSDADEFFYSVEKDVNGENIFDAAEYFEERQQQAEELKQRAAALSLYMQDYADFYTPEYYESMQNVLSTFNTQVDDVMSSYQPSLGVRAYQSEYLANREQKQKEQQLINMAVRANPDQPIAQGFVNLQNLYRTDTSYLNINDSWTNEELYTLGLLQQEDPAKAKEYARQVNDYHNAIAKEEKQKAIRDKATESFGQSALQTAGAIAATTATSMVELLDRLAEYAGRGTTTEKTYITPSDYAAQVQGAIANDLNQADENGNATKALPDWIPVIGGKGLGDAYGVAYSIGQNLANRWALGGLGSAGIYANMFANAAVSGIDEARRKGATGDQATLSGIAKGSLEVLTEKYGVDNLLEMGPAITWGDVFKSLGIQFVAEGIGEGANTGLGYIADNYILKDLSDYQIMKQEYLDQGEDEKTAKWHAFWDAAENSLYDAFSGGLSGIAMAGVETAAKTGMSNMLYRKYYGNAGDSLVESGLESPEGTNSRAFAEKLQQKLADGKKLSGNDLRIQTTYNEQQIAAEDRAEIKQNLQNELRNRGETEDVEAISELMTKKLSREKLTKIEQRTLEASDAATQILSELTDESAYEDGNWGTGMDILMQDYAMRLDNADETKLMGSAGVYTTRTAAETTTEETQAPAQATRSAPVAEDGKARQITSNQPIEVLDFASIDRNNATVQLKDGRTVDYSDVSFATEAEANRFYAVASLPGIDTENANNLLHTIEDANAGGDVDSVAGIREAYGMGYYGMQESDLAKGTDSSQLTPNLRKAVYDIGKQQRTTDAMVKATATEVTAKPAEGYKKVVFEGNVNRSVKKNAAEIRFVDYIADNFSGNTVHIYESFKGRDGKYYYRDSKGELHRAPNGRYVNGEIWLDIKSGDNGEGLMLNTFAHEMYHHIEKYNKSKANELAEFVVKELGFESVEKAVAEQIKKARKAGLGESYFISKGMTKEQAANEVYNRAMSDFVADSLETMFTRGNPAEAIAKLKTENRTLFDEIKAFVDKWVTKLKKYYSDKTISKEGELAAQLEKFEELQRLFMEAMQGAGENYRAALEEVVKENSKPVDSDEIHTDGAFVTDGEGTMYSIRSMKSDIADGKMFEDLMTYCGWTKSQVDTLRTMLTELVAYMTPFRDVLDLNETYGREGRRFSPYKPNSDPLYKISMDFSTLCSKRLLTQYVIEKLQLRENRPMSAEEQMAIRDMLNEYRKQEKGLQVACAMCYVEAARLKSPKQMQKWMDDPETYMRNYFADKDPEFAAYIKGKQEDFKESRGYARNTPKKDMDSKDVTALNKIRPQLRAEYKPTAEEQVIIDKAKSLPNSTYLTAANLANLSESNPTIYAAYTSFVRTATRSKSLETDELYYYGDSTRDNGNGVIVTDSFIEEVNRENGMRFSSWSDWRIQHMLDYITAVIDNSVRGAAMHGYTKFPEEVRVLGKTGMMFNMSGVAGTQTGLNEDGSLSFSETESIDVNEAIQLRKDFPETAGLQCIGVSDAHIRALMESDIIDYIIPYHTSGLNKGLRTMANIHGWKDYQLKQHSAVDKDAKLADAVDKEHWHEEPVFSEFFVGYDTGMSGIEAMRASAERYKQMCAERGLKPKFEEFAREPNYWKLLIDRKMINQKTGELIRQKPVSPVFDFGTIKSVVDRHVANYDSNMESKALNHIVENWDSIPKRIRDLKKSKKPVKKSVDNLSNQTLAAQPTEMFSNRDYNHDLTKDPLYPYTQREASAFNRSFINKTNELKRGEVRSIMIKTADYSYFVIAYKGNGKNPYKGVIVEKTEILLDDDLLTSVEEEFRNGTYRPSEGDYLQYERTRRNSGRGAGSNSSLKERLSSEGYGYLLEEESDGFSDGNYRTGDYNSRSELDNYSLRNEDNSPRAILSRIDPNSRKLKGEQQHLGFYQNRLKQLGEAERRLNEVNKKIRSLPENNRREIQKLQIEARNYQHNIDILNRDIRRAEMSDMFKRIVAEERKKFSDTALRDYKKEQKQTIKSMEAENRAIREELTGTQSVMSIMEDEFVRLAKNLEAKKINLKTMQEMFLNQSKQYDKDTQKWLREYRNLMSQYQKLDARNDRNLSKIEQLEQIILRQRQTAKAKVTSRRNTEMRHKIQRKADELNRLLLHGTKHRNVPEYLQPVVADILNAINMEVRDGEQRRANYGATLARYDRQIAMTSNPAEVTRLIEKRNEYAAKGDQFANKMAELKDAYQKIQDDKIPNMEIDEGLSARLMELFVIVGDTPLGQMTSEQLDAVNDVLSITQKTISNANKLHQEGQRKGIEETSKSTMREVRIVGGGAHKTTDFMDSVSKFGWNNLKPIYAFEAIGSPTLTNLFKNLRKGEDTLAVDLNEAKTFFQTQWRKHHGKDWDMEKKWKFTSTSGKSFELDINQIMSLYALSKRDQARDHLRVGGFSFDSQYKRKDEIKVGPFKIKGDVKTTDASAYNLTDETLGEIIGKLTADQRAFVDAMQAYLSDTMAAKGNEISMQKYGIRLFKEQNYFPLRVADQYMARVREQQTGDRKLKNSGFTKSVTPHAKNPVVLSSFTEVWAEHVDEMSLYHSFVLPLDDMNRVLNYHDMFNEETAAGSVVEAIRNAYGEGATQYIDQLIRDVNGGARTDSVANTINKWMSKAKKAQTMASLSVAIQQPSSILRACAMIDGKYFLGPKVTEKTHDRTWDEIKKWAPIAIIKEMGGFDVNVGKSTVDYLTDTAEYNGFGEKFKAMFTDEQFRDDAFGRLPALMDEMAWGAIWNAVKREQAELHPDVKGDAFMKMVSERFTDIIVHTQVYDSVFSRSGMMRSKDTGAKMLTSFMAEPTTTINMLHSALLQANRRLITKAQAAKTVGAIVASLALNSALVSVAHALRDDDEDKRFDEKWIEKFYNNFFDSLNPLNYIPILRDLQSMMQGYDVERADMALFGDLMNAINGLDRDDISPWEKTEAVIGSIGNIMGIPLKNIIRDGKGIFNTIRHALTQSEPKTKTGAYMARRGMDLSNGEEMLLAIQRGDEAHIQRVFGRFESQKEAESALQSAIREKYIAGDLSEEEAVDLLTTNFDREDANEVYWILEEWNYAKENDGSAEGYAKYSTLYQLIDDGGDYTSEINRLMEHGAEPATIRSQISKKYRTAYLADETVREEIRTKLQPVYAATGMDESDIMDKFNDWDFEAEYGMTYSEFKTEYKAGNATEAEMRQAMKTYGLLNYEIEEGIRSLNKEKRFEEKYGMSISEMRNAYDNGDISRNTLINALVFNGATKTEAQEEVSQRDVSNKYGIDYMKLDDAYKYGDISRQTFYNSLIDGGATKKEADEAILGYDWLKKNVQKYPDLQISDAKRFVIKISDKMEERTLTDYGVSIDSYLEYKEKAKECTGVDADGDGYADPYTKAKQLFAMIDAMPISNEAKDGLALVSNAMSTIKKYAPWR